MAHEGFEPANTKGIPEEDFSKFMMQYRILKNKPKKQKALLESHASSQGINAKVFIKQIEIEHLRKKNKDEKEHRYKTTQKALRQQIRKELIQTKLVTRLTDMVPDYESPSFA